MPVLFDFLVLVNDLYQKYLPEFIRKNIVFTLEMATSTRQIQCRTDRFMVQQMLEELLSNAAKFTEKGKVELDISMADGFITVILSDTGCGIPREHQNRIFDFFRQVDSSSSRKHEGSGLGLSIVKGMTELLGGAICLDSEVGRGTVFTIIVPVVYDESTASELVHEAIDKSKKSKKVLIVEDDITNYKYLFRVLKPNQRKRSVWVVDGDQAIRDCQTDQDIGLVLMDIKLPGIDGLEATRKIKQLRPDLPIVAVTAYAMEADRDKALAAGCDAYISKPFTRDELHQLLDKFGLDT
jgi:CheY-like chemotaxis protein